MTQSESPALQLIRLAWGYACTGTRHSWVMYNQTVRQVCCTAAETFRWHDGDLDRFCKIGNRRDGIGKCLGEGGLEQLYTAAVRNGNQSFCSEYERWAKRPPIIVDNVNERRRDRLCVGSTFQWHDEQVTVTSFNDSGEAVACSYEETEPIARCPACGLCTASARKKLLHRYTISAADVKAERARRRAN